MKKQCTGSCCYCEERCSFSSTKHKGSCACLAHRPAPGPAPGYERGVLDEHKSHVDFENELYATLVDPVAEGSIKEEEMRKQLLESARWYRQHVHDLETQLNALRLGSQPAGKTE